MKSLSSQSDLSCQSSGDGTGRTSQPVWGWDWQAIPAMRLAGQTSQSSGSPRPSTTLPHTNQDSRLPPALAWNFSAPVHRVHTEFTQSTHSINIEIHWKQTEENKQNTDIIHTEYHLKFGVNCGKAKGQPWVQVGAVQGISQGTVFSELTP